MIFCCCTQYMRCKNLLSSGNNNNPALKKIADRSLKLLIVCTHRIRNFSDSAAKHVNDTSCISALTYGHSDNTRAPHTCYAEIHRLNCKTGSVKLTRKIPMNADLCCHDKYPNIYTKDAYENASKTGQQEQIVLACTRRTQAPGKRTPIHNIHQRKQ